MSFPSSPQGQPALAGGMRGGRGSNRGSPRTQYPPRGGKAQPYHPHHAKGYPPSVPKVVSSAASGPYAPKPVDSPPSAVSGPALGPGDKNEKIPGNLPKSGNNQQPEKQIVDKNPPKSAPSGKPQEVTPIQPSIVASKQEIQQPAKPVDQISQTPQVKVAEPSPFPATPQPVVPSASLESKVESSSNQQGRPRNISSGQLSSPQSPVPAEKIVSSTSNHAAPHSGLVAAPPSSVHVASPLLPTPSQPPSSAPSPSPAPLPSGVLSPPRVSLPGSVGSPSLGPTSSPMYKQSPYGNPLPQGVLPLNPVSNPSPQKNLPLDIPMTEPKPSPAPFSPSKPFEAMAPPPVYSRPAPSPYGAPYMAPYAPYAPYPSMYPMSAGYPPQMYAGNMYPPIPAQYAQYAAIPSLPAGPPQVSKPAPASKKLQIRNPVTNAVVNATGGDTPSAPASSVSDAPAPSPTPSPTDNTSVVADTSSTVVVQSNPPEGIVPSKNIVENSVESKESTPEKPNPSLQAEQAISKEEVKREEETVVSPVENLPVGEVSKTSPPSTEVEPTLKEVETEEKLGVTSTPTESQEKETSGSSELKESAPSTSTGINIRDEDPNDFLRSPDEDEEDDKSDELNESEDENFNENFIALDYPEGVWGPHNQTGLKKYPRDFLLQFKDHCVERPEGLNERVVTDESKTPSLYPVRQSYHSFPRNSPSRPPQPNIRPVMNTFGPPGFDHHMVRANQQRGYPMNPRGAVDRRPRLEPLKKSENAWQRPKRVDDDKKTLILMKVNGILNKITRETFDVLSDQILNVGIDSSLDIMDGIISLLFEKALLEPGYSNMYADLCVKLSSVKLYDDSGKEVSFRVLLLNKCQAKFETKQALERSEAEKKLTDEEWEEKLFLKRKNILGNIKFIGELFKKGVLAERIIHFCITSLLQASISERNLDSMECLCGLMTNIGNILDHEKGKPRMDEYFREMKCLSSEKSIDSRLRFRLDDVIDLRARGWKKIKKDDIGRKEGDRTKPARVITSVLSRNPDKDRPPVQLAKAPPRSNSSSGLLPTPPTPPRHSPHRPPGIPERQPERRSTPDLDSSPNNSTPERLSSSDSSRVGGDISNFEKKVDGIIEEYLSIVDDNEVCECVKDLNEASSHSHIVIRALLAYFEKKEKDRLSLLKLFGVLFKAKLLEKSHFVAGFRGVLDSLSEVTIDIPRAPVFFGNLYAISLHNSWIDNFIHLRGWCSELDGRLVEGIYGGAFTKAIELESADALLAKLKDSGINSLRELFPKKSSDEEFKKFLSQHGLESISQY